MKAVYFCALDQDNNNYYYYYSIIVIATIAIGIERGGGSRIATVPEMLRLASTINNTKTAVIPICTLTSLNSAHFFFESVPCANHCAKH